ncbi:MAG: hypothetical protein IJ400_02535 [Clostridia bacterium]|nr:hypothetical protein [Clostridia bacterium]
MIYRRILGPLLVLLLSVLLAISIGASENCEHTNALDDNDCTTELICPDCSKTIKEKTSHDYYITEITPNENGVQFGLTKHSACSNEGCLATLVTSQDKYVELIGYSAGGSTLTATYGIDFDILTTYALKNDIYCSFGLVAGSKTYLGDNLPLNENGKPLEHVSKTPVSSYFNDIYDFNIVGLLPTHLDTEFVIAVYLIIDTDIYYFQGNEVITSADQLKYVTFNDIRGQVEGFGDFDFVETEQSQDRQKQQNASQSDYNTGSSYPQDQLDKIKDTAEMLTIGSTVLSYPNSAIFMSHFLSGSGDNLTLDIDTFLKNEIAKENRNQDINNALIACEAIAQIDSSLSFNQVSESLFHNLEGDWKYCLGSYFTSIKIENLTISYEGGTKYYSADVTYIIQDYYNWDEHDTSKVFGLVSPSELHQLHKAGMAKEFLTYGEKTYSLKWAEGIRVEKLGI